MAEIAKAFVSIEARLSDLKRELNKAVGMHKRAAKKVQSRWTKVGKKIKSSFINVFKSVGQAAKRASLLLVGAGVAAGTLITRKALNSWAEYERVWNGIKSVISSTRGAAKITAKEIWNLGTNFERWSRFGKVAILNAAGIGLTFTKISRKVFPQFIETAMDMSTTLGTDLKESIIQVGKALQDPIIGITALRRVGVNFNEEQTEIIKNLVKEGKLFTAQKQILKELQTEFGGSARAAGEGFGGALAKAGNAWTAFTAQIGKGLADVIQVDLAGLINTLSSPKSVDIARKIGLELGAIAAALSKIAKETDWVSLIRNVNTALKVTLSFLEVAVSKLRDLHNLGKLIGAPLVTAVDAAAVSRQQRSSSLTREGGGLAPSGAPGIGGEGMILKALDRINSTLKNGTQTSQFTAGP